MNNKIRAKTAPADRGAIHPAVSALTGGIVGWQSSRLRAGSEVRRITEAIIVAMITGGLSLAGVVTTCLATSKRSEQKQEVNLAVMKTEIDELTREVRLHNGFAQRMPVVEEQIKVINHRLADLENGGT